jgi:hypothetical protein
MSEIEFLTYPVPVKWTERDFKKYCSQSFSSCSIYEIPYLHVQQKILLDDQTRSVVDKIYHSISFISLNIIYTDEISMSLIQKLKNKHTRFS